MSIPIPRYTVKYGIGTLEKKMTYAQAEAWGQKNMPADLKKAGFKTSVCLTDLDLHGSVHLRVNFSKVTGTSSMRQHAA